MIRLVTRYPILHQRVQLNFGSIDKNEIQTFSQVDDWWSNSSSMLPLQAYNYARLNYIRSFYEIKSKPFQNLSIIDVGCGGGLLSESLQRLGGNVTALDATYQSYEQAKNHAKLDPSLTIQYLHSTAEEHIEQFKKKYDLVVSMEVIEHVNNPEAFLGSLSDLCNPEGMLFVSTINKTIASYLQVIIAAEYIVQMVPKGTHHWDKFIEPQKLEKMAKKNNLQLIDTQGFLYNPITNSMNKCSRKDINYIMVFKKQIQK